MDCNRPNATLHRHAGFTLIELAVIIVIVSVLAVIALPKLQSTTGDIEYDARQLLADIRYTQALSVSRGQKYRFVKTATNAYQILNQTGAALMLLSGNTTQTLTSGVTFTSLTNLPNSLISFGVDGTPYTDTSGTALASTATITISYGTATRNIQIAPQTGYGVLS